MRTRLKPLEENLQGNERALIKVLDSVSPTG
jgi:hypothetical protein